MWANVLRLKFSNARFSSGHPSLVWKILCQTRDVCDKGMAWLICNGKTINFWHDNWLEIGPLRGLLHNPLLPHEFNLKLGDVWDTHGNWDLGNLSFQFPPGISNHISASPAFNSKSG